MTPRSLSWLGVLLLATISSASQAMAAPLAVAYAACQESIGLETVARSLVGPFLPTDYDSVYGFGGFGGPPDPSEAQIIMRTMRCDSAVVDGMDLGPLTNAQYGVITARTDAQEAAGSPFNGIDNLQLAFATTSSPLAARMNAAGMAADHVPTLNLQIDAMGLVANNSAPLLRRRHETEF